MSKFVQKPQMNEVVKEMSLVSREQDVLKQFSNVRTSIQNIQRALEERYATKDSLMHEVKLLGDIVANTYLTNEKNSKS